MSIAKAALSPATRDEPALNPNQPIHRSDTPMTLNRGLCGAMFSAP